MYVAIQHAAFQCRTCGQAVVSAVVCNAQCIRTAVVQGMHDGVGHTAALAGVAWVVRCGDAKTLVPHDLVVGSDKVLRAATAAVTSQGPAPPAAKRRP